MAQFNLVCCFKGIDAFRSAQFVRSCLPALMVIGLTFIEDLRLSNTKTFLWALQMVIGLTNAKLLRVFDMHSALFIGS